MYTNIYQPTLAEVHPLFKNFVTKNLDVFGLSQRAAKGQQLLLTGGIFWKDEGWYCRSQASDKIYRVNGSCECPDRGVTVQHEEQDIKLCKHKMANYAYHRILLQHLNCLADTHVEIDQFNVTTINEKWIFCTEKAQFDFATWLVVDGGRTGLMDYESSYDGALQDRLERLSMDGESHWHQPAFSPELEDKFKELYTQQEYEQSIAYDGIHAWRF